jgi:hypothetical protein
MRTLVSTLLFLVGHLVFSQASPGQFLTPRKNVGVGNTSITTTPKPGWLLRWAGINPLCHIDSMDPSGFATHPQIHDSVTTTKAWADAKFITMPTLIAGMAQGEAYTDSEMADLVALLGTAAYEPVSAFDIAGSAAAAQAASQPLDADLTAISLLATTSFGRSLLTQADASAARTTLGAGTSSFSGVFADLTSKPTTLAGYGISDGVSSSSLATTLLGYASTSDLSSGLAGKFNTPSGTTLQYVRGDGTLATFPSVGSGTVTSVGLSSTDLSVSGSPVTVSGSITANLTTTGVSPGTYTSVTVDTKGRVTAGSNPSQNTAAAYSAGTVYALTTTPAKLDFGTTDPSITIPAADIANATATATVPIATLLSSDIGDADVATVIYTTSNSNDVLEVWGSRSTAISVGNINASAAHIVAVRLY